MKRFAPILFCMPGDAQMVLGHPPRCPNAVGSPPKSTKTIMGIVQVMAWHHVTWHEKKDETQAFPYRKCLLNSFTRNVCKVKGFGGHLWAREVPFTLVDLHLRERGEKRRSKWWFSLPFIPSRCITVRDPNSNPSLVPPLQESLFFDLSFYRYSRSFKKKKW